jgi:Condensation domain
LIPRLISRLNDLFAVALPLRAVFDNPGISELAEKVTSLRGATSEIPLVPVSREGDIPLSFAQESLWAIDQISPETGAYNISRALRLKGPLDTAALQASIDSIVSRHEAVRTVFPSQNGKPVPIIKHDCKIELVVLGSSDSPKSAFEEEVQRQVAEECRRPFNLAVGPLLRATLLRLADHEHILIVTMHHIISDGWSMGIFFDELVFGYNKLLAGEETQAGALSIQYADFAHWQRKSLRGDKLDQSLLYWQQQLAGAPLMTDLPTSRQRPPIRSFQGARHVFEFPNDVTAALKNLARAERVTLFMTLLGTYQTLLWTYAKDDDVVVGCPSAGRRPGTENLIGYFVNTLALRTTFSGDPTFREIMHRVAEATIGALTHEHVPFAKLVERLQPMRRLDHNPLFQVWFVLQAGAGERQDFAGLAVEQYPIGSEVTRHDLQLTVWENSSVLKAAFTYNTDILDSQTVAHLAEQFSVLLTTILEQPDIQANDLKDILKHNYEAYKQSREQEHQESVRQTLRSTRRKSIVSTSIT